MGDGSTQLYNAANVGVPRLIKDKKFPPNFTVNSKNYSFIVIAPQIKTWDYKTVAKDINDMLTYAIAKYRVDTTRIYVSGLSMGGGYTWEFAGDFARRVAAIVPICGASGPNDTRAKNLVNAKVAVWAFHNNDDGVVLPSNSIGYVNKINALNPVIQAKLTLWPTGGHDAWTKATNPTYRENNMNIYEWMLQYSKS
ncbi:dienelactone hydrolase family protein [Paraflavitalea speifideaquila]|uniref:carboxylesterase family protein n=1 Tax=Paraflavitalea speifideaquila TaxID=3076558 RepID=UPI0028E2B9C9|nr:dienelactone hydrolase family protein [Paraflavitalea speifideiaquila]